MRLADLVARSGAGRRTLATRDRALRLADFAENSALGSDLGRFAGRSVVLHVRDMALAAAVMIDLDGLARRLVLCPPGFAREAVESAAAQAEADASVHDGYGPALPLSVCCALPMRPRPLVEAPSVATEWVLPTSGTSGPPKLVVHTLETLTGAIADAPGQEWATFYDIRRYGGLQIFLRALAGSGSLRLHGAGESVEDFLSRLGEAGVTHISGTPSHWRKALMSGRAGRIDPAYVRLSGEIADDAILSALADAYPRARIEHAYASTEAGVAFAVADGRAGFPAEWLARRGPVALKLVDGALRIRSGRCALRFLGPAAPPLADADGFVDTGDMVEVRDGRCLFVGRRGGIVNVGGAKVHPEEVEAALNAHPAVRASRALGRRNPIAGAIVVAEIVPAASPTPGLDREILAFCRGRLPPHMVPASLRFVGDLPMTAGGKLDRHG